MSTDGRLGDKKQRSLARKVSPIPVYRAWAWHPFVEFCTPDDVHCMYDTRTGQCWLREGPTYHYTSCPGT